MNTELRKFKRICLKEKKQFYIYMLIGNVISFIGVIMVILVFVLERKYNSFTSPNEVIFYFLSGATTLIGCITEIIGELSFDKEYKEYLKKQNYDI